MHLTAEAPRPMMDHPAVIVARRAEQERLAAREAVLRELAQRSLDDFVLLALPLDETSEEECLSAVSPC